MNQIIIQIIIHSCTYQNVWGSSLMKAMVSDGHCPCQIPQFLKLKVGLRSIVHFDILHAVPCYRTD